MRRKNKGFTLIELLAVIVILGLLMAIAIPSVTKYITESRKKTVVSTIGNYITAMVNEVNDLTYTFTEENTIYAVPIECIALERGGTNPFGAWYQANDAYWAYVLVQYDDETSSYRYGYTFKDSAGYGLYPTAQSKLNEGGKQIKTGLSLTKPVNGKITNITAVDNWNGFGVNNSTNLIVLEAETEGNIGDGINTCTLQQKGDNYEQVEEDKVNGGSEIENEDVSLSEYGFYYNRLYRAFVDDFYIGFVFRKNNIISIYVSENDSFQEFEDVGDVDILTELGVSYDMFPIYEDGNLIVGFMDEGKKALYDGIEFELTDIELQYSIEYNLDKGVVVSVNPTKYNERTNTFTLINPTRDGYEFLGWTYNDVSVPEKNVIITKGSWGNKSYVANWKSTAFKVADLIKEHNTLITAEPDLSYPSHTINDQSCLYSSNATNSGKATYYFRGNVENNYVKFADLTWRIIRINENGTIRLILQDGIDNNKDYAMSKVYNKYTYMYYSNTDIAKPTVDAWYKTNITDKGFDSFVANELFCQQARVTGDYDTEYKYGSVTASAEKYYTPDFKCSTDRNGYGPLTMKVGLMIYDEVVFAGVRGAWVRTSYLTDENSGDFWTMSPGGFWNSKSAYFWECRYGGALLKTAAGQPLYNLRPVINLNANILGTGTGTFDDPYIIQTN